MTLSIFEYNLAILSIILIITIVVIIYYKKNEDDEQDLENPIYTVEDDNKNISINLTNLNNLNSNMYNNKDTYINIENFDNRTYAQSNIDNIFANNSNISNIIKSINDLGDSNPSLKLKYDTELIDKNLQSNISASLYSTTNDLIGRVDNSNVRINDKISTLTDQILDLEHIIEKLNLKTIVKPNYTKLKSLNNGAEMTLTQTPNTQFLDPSTGVNTAAYMVNLNNGCLSVGATDYDVYKCNDKNPKHLFKMEHIISDTAYQKNIDKSVPFNNVDLTTINYPFVLMRSINNKNCLTNQNGNITVQPCDTLTAQRWLPI